MENRVHLIFDLDGTLCPIKDVTEEYAELVPNYDMVEKMRRYARNGAKITIFTSRGMRTYGNDVAKIQAKVVPIIREWLKKWQIPCDDLIVGKPWAGENGLYIDDRTVRPDEFLEYDYDDLARICESSSIKKEDL